MFRVHDPEDERSAERSKGIFTEGKAGDFAYAFTEEGLRYYNLKFAVFVMTSPQIMVDRSAPSKSAG